jgi:hypothetical protein
LILGLVVTVCLAAACSSPSPATRGTATTFAPSGHGLASPWFSAPFTARANAATFGQDPSFTADGRVLSNEFDRTGVRQVYVSRLDGTHASCLTCGQPGPNGFPQERPQGDWILYCSYRDHPVNLGSPCLGGYGSELYAMRPDGTHVTRLTAPGMPFESAGTTYDNYHPYWSPDGTQLVWTHEDFLPISRGGAQWTMLVADFVVGPSGTPALRRATVVGPGGNTGYETQAWAPDGSGFLYTSFTSGGDPAAGWLNAELWFLQLHGGGASPAHPKRRHLTDDSPAWDEQALFSPDMRSVIWMSSRAAPTWYQLVVTAAQEAHYLPPLENETVGAMFIKAVTDPRFRTDLYQLDLATRAVRRLTTFDSVVPEFVFDHTGRQLLWSETVTPKRTLVGTFAVPSSAAPVPTTVARDTRWDGAVRRGGPTGLGTVERPTTTATVLTQGPVPADVLAGATLLQHQLDALAARLAALPGGGTCCG